MRLWGAQVLQESVREQVSCEHFESRCFEAACARREPRREELVGGCEARAAGQPHAGQVKVKLDRHVVRCEQRRALMPVRTEPTRPAACAEQSPFEFHDQPLRDQHVDVGGRACAGARKAEGTEGGVLQADRWHSGCTGYLTHEIDGIAEQHAPSRRSRAVVAQQPTLWAELELERAAFDASTDTRRKGELAREPDGTLGVDGGRSRPRGTECPQKQPLELGVELDSRWAELEGAHGQDILTPGAPV